MAKYYDKGGFTSGDFMEEVVKYLEPYESAHELMWLSIGMKYPLRAGDKPDTDWREDAFKFADYLSKWKTGVWLHER